jgi:hypothetical protein
MERSGSCQMELELIMADNCQTVLKHGTLLNTRDQ